jgi:3'(2'), 5'-bisphosphate nucleotidase
MSADERLGRLLLVARRAVRRAAVVARAVQGQLQTLQKADMSPVTTADFGVQAVISLSLRAQLGGTAVPLLAEEDASTLGAAPPLLAAVVDAVNAAYPPALQREDAEGRNGGAATSGECWSSAEVLQAIDAGAVNDAALPEEYWVLDPIDGTKGFVRRAQYCIGLALVQRGTPTLGVLGCPSLPFPRFSDDGVAGTLFSAARGHGATQERLPPEDAAGGDDGATRSAVRVAAVSDASAAVMCESAEAAHSERSV